jgi:hypothetical protein
MQCLTATNAKWSNGGQVTFFNAKSSQAGQWIQAPPSRSRTTVAHACPPPWERFEGLVVCWNFFGMQITRRWKRRFDEAVRRVTPYLEKL